MRRQVKHDKGCENASGFECRCRCGGALHGAVLVHGIALPDPEVQEKALCRASPRRWTSLPEAAIRPVAESTVCFRRRAMTGILSEFAVLLIEEVRRTGQVDAIGVLATEPSDRAADKFGESLAEGVPERQGGNHLWCVVLAEICRVYDQAFAFAEKTVDEFVEAVKEQLSAEVSREPGEDTRARDIYGYPGRRRRVAVEFSVDVYMSLLGEQLKQAVSAVLTAMKAAGEDAVMRHLRLMAAIMCPDPDRHPDVLKYCVWPLLDGPFREVLHEEVETQMRVWLRNMYPCFPGGRS